MKALGNSVFLTTVCDGTKINGGGWRQQA
jgi:hypothetical protein